MALLIFLILLSPKPSWTAQYPSFSIFLTWMTTHGPARTFVTANLRPLTKAAPIFPFEAKIALIIFFSQKKAPEAPSTGTSYFLCRGYFWLVTSIDAKIINHLASDVNWVRRTQKGISSCVASGWAKQRRYLHHAQSGFSLGVGPSKSSVTSDMKL